MPASAYLFPITTRLEWDRATVPGDLLSPVNPIDPIDVTSYAARDNALAYRDVVVAASIAKVALRVSDIWGFSPQRPTIAAPPAPSLNAESTDLTGTPSSPGSVDYVDNQSVPFDATSSDKQLYARDLLLYQDIFNVAHAALGDENPLDPLTVAASVSDAWSYADGVETETGIGLGQSLDVNLFKQPDRHLAWRDNINAGYIARLARSVAATWCQAQRLLIQVVDATGNLHEPEVYAFYSDDGRYRTWTAVPRLPNQLMVQYDRQKNTVYWAGEKPGLSGSPQVAASTVFVGGATVTSQPAVKTASDSEFFRQKSARLPVKPFSDSTVYQTHRPNDFILSGGVYQLDSALMTVPGATSFDLPVTLDPGCTRVGLLVKPSRTFSLKGFQIVSNTDPAVAIDGTAVTMSSPASVSWAVTVPAGQVYYSLTLTDKTAPTPSFAVRVRYNSEIIFEGSYVFNSEIGTPLDTQSVQFLSNGNPAVLSVEWMDGPGQLTIESINIVTATAELPSANYNISVQLNTLTSRPIQLMGVPERVDAILFDVVVTDTLTQPKLTVTWAGGGGMVMFIYAYDIKTFDVVEPVSNPDSYSAYKASLTRAALGSVAAAYNNWLGTNPATELRAADSLYEFVWNSDTYTAWLNAIASSGESRIRSAFQIAGPGDLGRPALIPDGLQLVSGTTVKANYAASGSIPVLRALQPWMMSFGVLVAGPDFWPLDHPGCTWYGPLKAINVIPDFEVSTSPSGSGRGAQITNMTGAQHTPNAPDSAGFLAYTLQNLGPSVGTTSQTFDYTVWMVNLRVGSVYTLTSTIQTAPVGTSAWVSSSFSNTFVAAAATQSYTLPTITAAVGYKIQLLSVTLS